MFRNLSAFLSAALLGAALSAGVAPPATHAAARQPQLAAPELVALPFVAGAGAGQPSVVADPGHGFILTWQQRTADTSELWFALFDRDGREQRRARIAAGTGWFVNWADFPSLAVLDNGDWVTYWLEKRGASAGAYDLRVVRSSDRGRTWSAPVMPHAAGTATQHGFVSAVPLGGDRVLLAWLDGVQGAAPAAGASGAPAHDHDEEDAPMTLRSIVLTRRGAAGAVQELDASTCSCCQTDMARWQGRTLLAYRDRSPQEIRDIAFVMRSSSGRWSAPRVLSRDDWRIEGCPVNGPALAVNDRRLLVAWPTAAAGPTELRYTIRASDAPAPALVLDRGPTQGRVDVQPWGGQGFLVAWLGSGADQPGLQLAGIGARGELLHRQLVHPTAAGRVAGFPRLASLGDRALLAWPVAGAERSAGTISLRLLRPARARRDDAEAQP
jgi:hypothetical protein